MNNLFFLALLFLTQITSAFKLPDYLPGTGNKYFLQTNKEKAEIQIIVISKTENSLVLEIKSSLKAGFLPTELIQRFELQKKGKEIVLGKGYVYSPILGENTYKLAPEYLKGYDGVEMASFLGSELDPRFKKVGSASVKTKEGKVPSTQYEFSENGQKIEFWLSSKIKPIPLAALRSTGSKSSQNYVLGYDGPIENYKSPINPSSAIPMNDQLKSMLPKPTGKKKSLLLP